MDEEQPSLGQSVRAARIAKGYSQAKLAKLVGAKQQTIGKIEKGKITQGPTVYELVALLNLPGSALPGYLRGTSHTIPFYPLSSTAAEPCGNKSNRTASQYQKQSLGVATPCG